MIGNTADDMWMFGLKICPDLDTVMYTLGDGIDERARLGSAGRDVEREGELAAYGVEPTWFGLGDRDIATHLVRTQMLERRLHAQRGDRSPVRALAAGRTAAPDDATTGSRPTW